MEIERIAVRAILIWLFLFLLLRLSGHSTIAQLTGRSLVLTLILSELLDSVLFSQVPVATGIVAMGTVTVTALLVALGTQHSERFERLVEGRPYRVLRQGAIDRRERRQALIGMAEIGEQMRHHGLEADDWRESREVIVEGDDAQVSVLLEEWAQPVQKRDRAKVREARR